MEPIDVIKRFYECLASRNVEGLEEVVGEDMKQVTYFRGTFEGKEAMMKRLQEVMVEAAPLRPIRHIAQGEYVASEVEVRTPPVKLVDIFRVTDGKIREMIVYPFQPVQRRTPPASEPSA